MSIPPDFIPGGGAPLLRQPTTPSYKPTTPSYKPGTDVDTAYNQLLEKLTPELEEAARYIQPQNLREVAKRINTMDEPLRRQERLRVQRSIRTYKDFDRAAGKLAAIAKRENRPDLAQKIKEARRKAIRGEQSPIEVLKSGGEMLFKALDWDHRNLIRSWSTPKREGDKPGKDVGAEEWMKRIREEADKGEFLPKLLTLAGELPGWAIGTPLGGAVAAAGVASDLWEGKTPTKENIWKTVRETQKDVADTAIMMGTSPSSWLSLGTAGSAKNASQATLRATTKKLGKKKAQNLAEEVGELASRKAGTAGVFDDVVDVFENAGLTAADAKKIFGDQGEFFARSQLRAQVPGIFPGASKLGVDLPQITGKEYALGKAAQKAFHYGKKPIESVTGSTIRELYDPTKMLTKQARKRAKGFAGKFEKEFLNKYEELSKIAPASAERREWIVKNVIDPFEPAGINKIDRDLFYTKGGKVRRLDKIDPNQLDDKMTQLRAQMVEQLEDLKQIEDIPMRRANRKTIIRDYKKLTREALKDETLLRQLAPQEQAWVKGLDRLFGEVHDAASASGYLKKNRIAWNQYTGRYFPRDFKRQWGILEDIPGAKSVRPADPSKARSRQGAGLELGISPEKLETKIRDMSEDMLKRGESAETIAQSTLDLRERMYQLGKIKGVADPHRAVPNYIQRAARGSGAARLESEMLKTFGKPIDSKLKVSSFGDYTPIGETGQMLPNDLADIMYGAFDSSYQTFRNWMARVPGGKTPAARGVMKSFEVYANLTNFWKKNVLVTRPGYHVLNAWNDSLQMVVDGNAGAAMWIGRANKILRKTKDGKRAGQLKTPNKTYSADELVELAEEYNIPIIDATGMARLEQVGLTAGDYKRFQRVSQKQLKQAEKAVRKKHGRVKGEEFENLVAKELDGQMPMTAAQRKALRKETLLREPLEFSKDYTGALGGLPAITGEYLAKQWEAHAKMGHFMWRLSKGDSPAIAAKRTFDVLLDYADPSRWVQVGRWFLPFATWMMTAPKMTGRLVATRPGAVAGVHRFFEAQQPDEKGPRPGSYVAASSPYYHLGDTGKRALGTAREMVRTAISPITGEDPAKIKGTGVGPGLGAVMRPREPFGESMTLPLDLFGISNLAQGRGPRPKFETLVGSMAPLPKFLAEQVWEKEALTGKALQRATPLGMFPSKMPVVPEALRTAPPPMKKGQRVEETPWLTRYVLPMMMSPAQIQLSNMYLYGKGGGEEGAAPISTIGRYRQYTPSGQAGNVFAQQILNQTLGLPAYTVSPMDVPYEQARALRDAYSSVRQALLDAEKMRRARER